MRRMLLVLALSCVAAAGYVEQRQVVRDGSAPQRFSAAVLAAFEGREE